jgi:hypothetical protein
LERQRKFSDIARALPDWAVMAGVAQTESNIASEIDTVSGTLPELCSTTALMASLHYEFHETFLGAKAKAKDDFVCSAACCSTELPHRHKLFL